MLELYKKQTNKTQYVKMSKAFHKIYLHHQALYKINNFTEFTNATKWRIKKKKKLLQINRHESLTQLVQLLATKVII